MEMDGVEAKAIKYRYNDVEVMILDSVIWPCQAQLYGAGSLKAISND